MKSLRVSITLALLAVRLAAADATVAQDGSADFKTVQEAINAAPQTTAAEKPWVIRVKPGTYKERLYIQREKRFVKLVGDDAATTTVTYDLNANLPGPDGKPIGTFRTATVYVDADDFTFENLTLENAAGAVGQALAVSVNGDRTVFRKCRLLGWQDTVFTNRGRHYWEECEIAGHVDFIFGGGTDWFERCEIVCRKDGYITAASTPREQPHGFVFNRCRLRGENPEVRTYFGRPWRDFAATVFLNCEMTAVVRPEGWHDWKKPERQVSSRYSESGSTGEGAAGTSRVPWAKPLAADALAILTVERVLGGTDSWNPRTP